MAVEKSNDITKDIHESLKILRDDIQNSDDADLFDDLSTLVMSVKDAHDKSITQTPDAINKLFEHLSEAKSTMTSLPKQFIYMSYHMDILKEINNEMKENHPWKKYLSDLISVVSIVTSTPGAVLSYRLAGRREPDLHIWGMEYVKRLIEDIRQEYYRLCDVLQENDTENDIFDDLYKIAYEVVDFCANNNAEIELCDLAMEIEQPELIKRCLNDQNYKRILLYIKTCTQFVYDDELEELLEHLRYCYIKYREYAEALIIAIRQNHPKYIMNVLLALFNDQQYKDQDEQNLYIKQLGHMIYSHRISLDVIVENASIYMPDDEQQILTIVEMIRDLVPASSISENFQIVARELDILQPKKPEEVYKEKTNLYYTLNNVGDSTRSVVANAVVSAFVNAAFTTDCVLLSSEPDWLNKLKEASSLTAVACTGLVYLWDIDQGLLAMDKYLYSSDIFVKAGAYVGCGLLSTGNPEAGDTTLAILSTALTKNTSRQEKMASVIALGIAMAGTCNTTALDLLDDIFQKHSTKYIDIEIISTYAIAVGMIALGTRREREVTNLNGYLHSMKDRLVVKDVIASYVVIGYCLLFFGSQSTDNFSSFASFPKPLKSYIFVMLNTMAYAGSGNVAIIEDLFVNVIEQVQKSSENKPTNETSTKSPRKNDNNNSSTELEITDKHIIESTAVLGVAAIGINDESGISMCFRLLNDVLQVGNKILRRIVPVGLALLSASNPQMVFIDTLSKLSHDNDPITSCNAILALGIIGAGTNNAKIASLLRQLSGFFYKDPINIFAARLSIGLLHMGKGLMSLSPIRDNKSLVSNVSLASLLLFCLACVDSRTRVLSNEYYLFFWIACAMKPRFLVTLDEKGEHINIPVRVGQVVDTVGQAGDPRTITGFQTHKTPVLLGYNERAELASDEYIPISPILEGVVYIKKNPDYQSD